MTSKIKNWFKGFKKPISLNYYFHFKEPLTDAQKRAFFVCYQEFFKVQHTEFYNHIDGHYFLVLEQKKLTNEKLQAFYNLWKVIGLQSIESH